MLFNSLTTASCICFWEKVVIRKTIVIRYTDIHYLCVYIYTYTHIYFRLHSHTVAFVVDQ